ncbi:MAG: sugar phosphate isomerase/epimerase [Pseudomonadales bacterium]|nr:sugar phosphate isomerase/epimerase [Pseudomonadales bacterium]
MNSINRREFMALSATVPILAAAAGGSNLARGAQDGAWFVSMHEISSAGFDFRTAMEGWARAGIKYVEPDLVKAREFEAEAGKGSAKRLLNDLGLTVVSSSNQLFLDESGPRRAAAIEDLKWKVEMAESLGADRLVMPSAASEPHTQQDYDQVYENLREAADIARPHKVTMMLEFTRNSKLVSTLRTSLQVVRSIDHPNLRAMLDIYHFWAGMSKFEDLEEIRQGEIHHVHFADTPAQPSYEVFAQKDRAWPGEGIAPLARIVAALKAKGYSGPASLELFDPVVQNTDPYEVGAKALRTITPYIV